MPEVIGIAVAEHIALPASRTFLMQGSAEPGIGFCHRSKLQQAGYHTKKFSAPFLVCMTTTLRTGFVLILPLLLSGGFPDFPTRNDIVTHDEVPSAQAIRGIRKYLSAGNFTDAGLLLRTQLRKYPGDPELTSLLKTWTLDDYKTNYLGSEVSAELLHWTGSTGNCDPGTISAEAKKRFLIRLNYFRRLAGVPDHSVLDTAWNHMCMLAALMMDAQDDLSHAPGRNWACFTPAGANAASNSNLSLGENCSDALTGQISDDGSNNTSAGHRRWILYPYTRVFGMGSTDNAMALWVLGGRNSDYPAAQTAAFDTQFVAWPPAGFMPLTLIPARWSFSLENADFSKAEVHMVLGGKEIPCTIFPQSGSFGLNSIVWEPEELPYGLPFTCRVTVENVGIYALRDGKSILLNKQFTYNVESIRVAD